MAFRLDVSMFPAVHHRMSSIQAVDDNGKHGVFCLISNAFSGRSRDAKPIKSSFKNLLDCSSAILGSVNSVNALKETETRCRKKDLLWERFGGWWRQTVLLLVVSAAGRVDSNPIGRVNHAEVSPHHVFAEFGADDISRRRDNDRRRSLYQDPAAACRWSCRKLGCWITQHNVATAGRLRYRQRRRSQRLQAVHQLLCSHRIRRLHLLTIVALCHYSIILTLHRL